MEGRGRFEIRHREGILLELGHLVLAILLELGDGAAVDRFDGALREARFLELLVIKAQLLELLDHAERAREGLGNQKPSEAIRSHQKQSEAIRAP